MGVPVCECLLVALLQRLKHNVAQSEHFSGSWHGVHKDVTITFMSALQVDHACGLLLH